MSEKQYSTCKFCVHCKFVLEHCKLALRVIHLSILKVHLDRIKGNATFKTTCHGLVVALTYFQYVLLKKFPTPPGAGL